jgi:hypothetical protein
MDISLFDACDTPPVLFGTGTLFIFDGSNYYDAGNFNLVNFIGEGDVERAFRGSDEVPTPLSITTAYRLECSGDSFSNLNLSRMLNNPLVDAGPSDIIELDTVRDLRVFQVKFVKNVSSLKISRCFENCWLEITFWRAYFDFPFTWGFVQDEQTFHRWNLIALPDAVNHPTSAYGKAEITCGTVGS